MRDLRFMRIANDPGDAGELAQFFGGALGVTAGDDEFRGWARVMKFADGVAGLGVCRGGDGASVDDDDIRARCIFGGQATAIEQLAFQGGAISLRGAAAELFDMESGHYISLSERKSFYKRDRLEYRVHREELSPIRTVRAPARGRSDSG